MPRVCARDRQRRRVALVQAESKSARRAVATLALSEPEAMPPHVCQVRHAQSTLQHAAIIPTCHSDGVSASCFASASLLHE